jgi:hypothetical protein
MKRAKVQEDTRPRVSMSGPASTPAKAAQALAAFAGWEGAPQWQAWKPTLLEEVLRL